MSSPGSVRLGRIWSVPVFIRPGALFMGVLLVILFAPRLSTAGYGSPWLVAACGVVSLYASVLVHEIAHVAAARADHRLVQSVTLHLLGGETLIASESRSAREEFVSSASGPLASLALALAGMLAAAALGNGHPAKVAGALGTINLLVAAVNVLPALPLDGGRMVRAAGWALTGNERIGVVIAGRFGQLAAAASFVVGVWLCTRGGRTGWLDFLLCALVGVFMWRGSSQSLRLAHRARRIENLRVSRLVDSSVPEADCPRLPLSLHGGDLLRAMTHAPADVYAVVDDETGEVVGSLRTRTVNRAYRTGVRR
ncbi:MAG: hypothetical protein QM597_09395 [Aeromicrobium sp.]|uniref:site-2 protease family protein n=1 Tax=Aeromicrobium sp. TaxID=1871063 RepID=UPI0039E70296